MLVDQSACTPAGKSPHTSMIEAQEERAAQAEACASVVAEALDAEQDILKTGEAYAMGVAHRYLLDGLDGKTVKRPQTDQDRTDGGACLCIASTRRS